RRQDRSATTARNRSAERRSSSAASGPAPTAPTKPTTAPPHESRERGLPDSTSKPVSCSRCHRAHPSGPRARGGRDARNILCRGFCPHGVLVRDRRRRLEPVHLLEQCATGLFRSGGRHGANSKRRRRRVGRKKIVTASERLARTAFRTSRLLDFVSEKELVF